MNYMDMSNVVERMKWNLKKRNFKPVLYSYEHGDENLPRLKDLVSDIPDPQKDIIIDYLKTNCVMVSPGRVEDEIEPGNRIGSGNTFSDGVYYWNDVFANYVEKYNIPVPNDFRKHILANYADRRKTHALLRLVDRVEIKNNPYLGYVYHIIIHKNGLIEYWNNLDRKEKVFTKINFEDTEYMIDPILTELFCYDTNVKGSAVIDGYHWEINFFKKIKHIKTVEGWPDEDAWRYDEIKRVLKFVERYVPYDLGTEYME